MIQVELANGGDEPGNVVVGRAPQDTRRVRAAKAPLGLADSLAPGREPALRLTVVREAQGAQGLWVHAGPTDEERTLHPDRAERTRPLTLAAAHAQRGVGRDHPRRSVEPQRRRRTAVHALLAPRAPLGVHVDAGTFNL